VYAIVRSGGRQLKASVGEVLELDRRDDAVGTTVELTPLLLVDGETNAGIARRLFIAESTAKAHVKHILRKIGASNRAEAVSRYLRHTAG